MATIRPAKAPVKPRVMVPEAGSALPLEDVIADDVRRGMRFVEIHGPRGCGKTTALAHLAHLWAHAPEVAFVDYASVPELPLSVAAQTVVYATPTPSLLAGEGSYLMAPWGEDEVIEYLLAVHPDRCKSVIHRIRQGGDSHKAHGCPGLWQIILDLMAADEGLKTAGHALRREFLRCFPDRQLRGLAERYALAAIMKQEIAAQEAIVDLLMAMDDTGPTRILAFDSVCLIVAAAALADALANGKGRSRLRQILPVELIRATAAELSKEGAATLARWIGEGPQQLEPMAASLLHAWGPGWAPSPYRPALLDYAYLRGAKWPGCSVRKAGMAGADLSRSDLSDADLTAAHLRGATFHAAVLRGAILTAVDSRLADFAGTVMAGVQAAGAVFDEATLAGADLSGARLMHASFRHANLSRTCLAGADLRSARLRGAAIAGADFSSADLSSAELTGLRLCDALLAGARFAEAILEGCSLAGVELPGADFTEADLRSSDLTGSRMPDATFAFANLCGACLGEVDWPGVDLTGADLRQCTFHFGSSRCGHVDSPLACEGSRTGFYTDEFDQQTYRPVEEIRKANLRGADLREARLDDTDFYLVDLREAKYSPAQYEHLLRCQAILFDRQ